MKKYIAEFLGAFTLSLLVGLSLASGLSAIAPLIAGIVVMCFVYTVGTISGAHLNPAITIAFLSIRKIAPREAGMYVFAQLLGGVAALGILAVTLHRTMSLHSLSDMSLPVFLAETFGALLFAFGIAAVVNGAVSRSAGGLVVGTSLILGILMAALLGSNGILNPAVALGIQSGGWMYLLAPIVGAVLGMQLYEYLIRPESAKKAQDAAMPTEA